MRSTFLIFLLLFIGTVTAQSPRFLLNLQTGINTDLKGFDNDGAHFDASLNFRFRAQPGNAIVLGAGISQNNYIRFIGFWESFGGGTMINIARLNGVDIDRRDAYLSFGYQIGLGSFNLKPHFRLNYLLSGSYAYLVFIETSAPSASLPVASFDDAEFVVGTDFGAEVTNPWSRYIIDLDRRVSYQLGIDVNYPISRHLQVGLHFGRNFLEQHFKETFFQCNLRGACARLPWPFDRKPIAQMTYALNVGVAF